MNMSLCRTLLFTLILSVGAVPAVAKPFPEQEEETPRFSDRWQVTIGGVLADMKTSTQVGFGSTVGSFIRLEEDLELDDGNSEFILDGFYRFRPRHALAVRFVEIDRSAKSIIDDRFEIGELVFDVNAHLTTDFKSTQVNLIYKYSFINNGVVEAGVAAGLSMFDYDIFVEGEATVDDGMGGVTTQILSTEQDILAPVPTIGIFLAYAIRPNLVFHAGGSVFDLEVSDYDGRLLEINWALEWYFSRHAGLGIGFTDTEMDVEKTAGDPFRVDYRYGGFTYYLSLVF